MPVQGYIPACLEKLALLAVITITGDLIRCDITDQANVVTKSEGTCGVIGSDQNPRGIPACSYKIGYTLVITYKQGMAPVEKYQLKT